MKAHHTLILRIGRSFRLAVTQFLPAIVVSLIACTTHAASYVFTNIADSTGIFAPSGGPVGVGIGSGPLSINNFGTVVFSSLLYDGRNGVFTGNGGPTTPIALSGGSVFSLVSGGSINAAGTVAFAGQLIGGGSGIYTGNGGPATPVALSSEGFTGLGGVPKINDSGRVAFGVSFGAGSSGIFLRGGGQPEAEVASEGATFSGVSDFSINSFGTVAFRGFAGSSGIFTGNGGPITTIALTPMPQGITPAINDLGTVVFAADSGSTVGTKLLLGNGGPVTIFVSNAGPFAAFGIYPAINNNGTVAFLAGLDVVNFEVRDGLFIGPDSVADKVLLTNEPLFGSTLVSFAGVDHESPGNIDINDAGQIAFHYKLANGRQGIAVATPIPEPSAVVLLLAATVGICARRFVRLVLDRSCANFRVFARLILLRTGTLACFACTAHAASYVFTNIADSTGIFAPSGGPVGVGIGSGFLSINNFGTVAFSSLLYDGRSGVFKGNGGSTTPIALSGGAQFSLVGGASINASGTVAFLGQLDAGGSGVFTGNGGPTTTVAISSPGVFSSFGSAAINDSGTVAFAANTGFGGVGIFRQNGASTQTIVSATLPNGPGFNISINSAGVVAFRAILGSVGDGVFTGNGGPLTTITLGAFPTGITPSINDSGTVAFAIDSGSSVGTRILTGSGGPVTTYVSNAGLFSGFGIHPAINNSGTVAFLAGLDVVNFEVRDGLFTGPDSAADKVLLTNEPLFGSTLVSFAGVDHESPGNIDINDAGQIAFHYKLADGRQGIAVATPTPEPSTAVLLLVGMGLSFGVTRRRRQADTTNGK